MKRLFVGGHLDGEWLEVSDPPVPYVTAPVPHDGMCWDMDAPLEPMEVVEYALRHFIVGRYTTVPVYVLSTLRCEHTDSEASILTRKHLAEKGVL